jgi:hypothetical protein
VAGAALWSLLLSLTACTPESRILFGKWQSHDGIVGLVDPDGQALVLPGGVELVLGHYGRDVVGVVRFYAEQFAPDDVWGDLTVPRAADCPCSVIQGGQYDDEARRVIFTVSQTDGCPPAAALSPPAGKPALVFTLTLTDDDTLSGTVQYQGKDTKRQSIAFERNTSNSGDIDENDRDKECEHP